MPKKSDLTYEHELFALHYAKSFDSLASYKKSHASILRDEANKLLESPQVWEKIIATALQKELISNPIINQVLDEYRRLQLLFKQSPFEVYISFTKPRRKKDLDNLDPVESITTMVQVYHFFGLLPCTIFLYETKKSLQREFEFFNFLLRRHPKMIKHIHELNKILPTGHTSFDDILDQCSVKLELGEGN
ncbi:MAG TPA: hypothetical protein PLY70_00665 [Saprospiraceae bacterium]|nr:hypothetical protein [Saprospiraceae bacterium]HPN68151.1 hypothetical protein [Saprospiraceae bacterium]